MSLAAARGARSYEKHGHTNSPAYSRYSSMIDRCYNPKNAAFANYGGRGITVCERWVESFTDYLADVGEKPGPGFTLDRIDNERGYEPENVRWATRDTQNRNHRANRYYTHDGRTMCLKDWAREVGIHVATITNRIDDLGWSFERAISVPPGTEHVKTRLTPEMKDAVRRRHAATGMKHRDLAQEFGVSKTLITRILKQGTGEMAVS